MRWQLPCTDSCHALTAEQRYSNSAHKPVAPHRPTEVETPEAEFLDEIQTKVFTSFPPCYSQSPRQFCMRFLFLQIQATSYSFCKEEWRKTWQKIIPPSPCFYVHEFSFQAGWLMTDGAMNYQTLCPRRLPGLWPNQTRAFVTAGIVSWQLYCTVSQGGKYLLSKAQISNFVMYLFLSTLQNYRKIIWRFWNYV